MIVVAVAVFGFLAIILSALAVPAVAGAITKAQMVHTLNNARQIYFTTEVINADNEAKGHPAIWPSTSGTSSSMAAFFNQLNFEQGDIERTLSAPGIKVKVEGERGAWAIHCHPNPAFRFYAVGDRPDDGMQVFISSFNVKCAPGSITIDKNAVPFGGKGGVILRKSGSGESLSARILTQPAIQETIPKDQAEAVNWK